jgi:hypothetical protein
MLAPAADLARARQRSEALSEVDARRMIEAGLALEQKRIAQRRANERAGYGRRITDVVGLGPLEANPEV